MSKATVEELQRNLENYLNQVENGAEFLICNGDKVIARLSPVNEAENWNGLALQGLAAAYGENEPEYTAHMLKESNPEYRT